MTPLIVLGVDGLDWQWFARNRQALPTLSGWPSLAPLTSIFPPDSIPAWTTIFTGDPPGEHGRLDSIDYLDKTPGAAATAAAEGLPHRTFWDKAGDAGRKVCIVNPFLAYPAWDVNGVMVSGPVFVDGSASITGIDPAALGPLPELGGIVTFPTSKTIGPFIADTLRDTRAQADFGLRVLGQVEPDLFFINLLTVDRLKHFVWRFVDPQDPTYPGDNPYRDAVDRAYALVDEIAADYARHGDVVILSDHGHRRRCTRMLYVDEVLRRAGLVHADGGASRLFSKSYLLERAKKTALRASYELAMEERMYRVARRLPNRKSLKYSSFSTDEERSIARLSRTFGRNQHSGVELLVDTPANRRSVIDALTAVRDPETGDSPVEWIREREELIDGRRRDRYPAVLFKLKGDYGVDFGLYGGLFAPDVNHRRISGGHKPEGVFAASMETEPPASIENFHDYVLDVLGVTRADARPARE